MKEEIEKVLADVAARYNDRRLHVCHVTVDAAEEGAVKLAGRVLEASYLEAVRQSLPAGVRVDASGVNVLRAKTRTMTVATNLTDLHVEPSFLSELLTQVTNGVTLEILEEKEKWAFVRQADGYLGWAYLPYLTGDAPAGAFTHIMVAPSCRMRNEPTLDDVPFSGIMGGTTVRVVEEREETWSRIIPAGSMLRPGWVLASRLRALASLPLPAEETRRQMIDDGRFFRGVYYLWGGASAFGIDCSGFAQLVHRMSGYTIPRDADMQFAAGRPVEGGAENFRPGDLLFFSGEHNRRKISHVGISTGGWNMIHSSRTRNGVYEDDVQATPHLRDTFAGARTFVR